MTPERQYEFSWDFIGDIAQGRPNLGNMTRIEVYRLFQYTLRDVLEQSYGTEEADRLLYRAGFLAGTELCKKFVGRCESLEEFVKKVEALLIDLKIGVLRIEEMQRDTARFVLTVAEDLDCSGLPEDLPPDCSGRFGGPPTGLLRSARRSAARFYMKITPDCYPFPGKWVQ